MESIRIPSAWSNLDDLTTCEAGRAYVLRQLDRHSQDVPPEHEFLSSRAHGDPARYWVYSDDSLWFVSNAEDEVWCDYRDFVQDLLLRGLRFSNGLCWTKEEYEMADYHCCPWLIDDMDKQLLLLYCGGDEGAARDLVERSMTSSQGDRS